VERLFQYSLAVAALSEDYRQRELGPIHLIKYAYLADVAYAQRHEGATFTGTDWRFYHFGPWSASAFDRIEPALEGVGAERKSFSSRYADDHVRYALNRDDAEHLARRLEDELPWEMTGTITSAIQQHGTDTADLLRHVYLTPPMLNARPNELLDFRSAVRRHEERDALSPESPRLGVKARKRRAELIEQARAEIRRRLSVTSSKRVPPTPAPRYDDVFFKGTAWLEAIAGEPISALRGEVEFDESVWLSSQRRDPDAS
jgi:hypothetical protein